jgi:predicted Zn-dependent protease
MAFTAAGASAQGVGLSGPALSSGSSNPMGAPEPVRPTLTTPYDGAIAAYRAGRVDEALGVTDEALKTDPRNAQLRFLRGVILAERGRTDEAQAIEAGGASPRLVRGDPRNLKVTWPADIALAEGFLRHLMDTQ